jgi:hypothetical protein
MSQLTDAEKVQVCALLLAGEPLPPEWQERLFPGSTKPPEPGKPGTEAPAQTPAQTKLLYDIKEAAARLSISGAFLRKLIRQRRLRPVPDIHKILLSESELQRFSRQL